MSEETSDIARILEIFHLPTTTTASKDAILQKYWEPLCGAIGPDRTRDELIPYIRDVASRVLLSGDEEDDIDFLLTIASVLSSSLEYVGGPQHVETLLIPLLDVCESEDVKVQVAVSFSVSIFDFSKTSFDEKAEICARTFLDLCLSRHGTKAFVRVVKKSLPDALDSVMRQLDILLTSESPLLEVTACHVCSSLLELPYDEQMTSSFFQGFLDCCISTRPMSRKESVIVAPDVLSHLLEQLGRIRMSKSDLTETHKLHPTLMNLTVPYIEKPTLQLTTMSMMCLPSANASAISANPDQVARQAIEEMVSQLCEAISTLSSDHIEAIRIHTVTAIAKMMHDMMQEKTVENLYYKMRFVFDRCGEDSSWMVRCAFVKSLVGITTKNDVIEVFQQVLSFLIDPEVEVRIASILVLSQLSDSFPEEFSKLSCEKQSEFLELLRTSFVSIVSDPSMDVRMVVAEHLINIASTFDPKATINTLFSVFSKLLRDDNLQVRFEAFKSLASKIRLVHEHEIRGPEAEEIKNPKTSEVKKLFLMGVADGGPASPQSKNGVGCINFYNLSFCLCQSLIQCLKAVTAEPLWRIRKSIILIGISLIPDLPDDSELKDWLEQFILNSLKDPVNANRLASADAVGKAAITLGLSWIRDKAVTPLKELLDSKNYLDRLILSQVVQCLFVSLSSHDVPDNDLKDFLLRKLIYFLKHLIGDPILNVQLHILNGLSKAIQQSTLHPGVKAFLQTCTTTEYTTQSTDFRIAIQELSSIISLECVN